MSDLITQMRRHVASYKTLSPHRQCCLDMCDEIERLTVELQAAREQMLEDTAEIERLAYWKGLENTIMDREDAVSVREQALQEVDDGN